MYFGCNQTVYPLGAEPERHNGVRLAPIGLQNYNHSDDVKYDLACIFPEQGRRYMILILKIQAPLYLLFYPKWKQNRTREESRRKQRWI
jgi:hypothetical protein